jgi:hypothetical protein
LKEKRLLSGYELQKLLSDSPCPSLTALGIELRDLEFARQVLYHLSHTPNPKSFFLTSVPQPGSSHSYIIA